MFIKKHITTNTLYFICLVLLAMSLPLSKYTMGLFQFFLVFIWLIYGIQAKQQDTEIISKFSFDFLKQIWGSFLKNTSQKIDNFLKNGMALILISLFLIFLIGFFRGGDMNYVLTDLRGKLPLLALPLIIAGLPALNKNQFNILLLAYVLAVIIGTIFSAYELFYKNFTDIREISVFISPVRFSLNICFSIVILFSLITKKENFNLPIKILFAFIIIWFSYILFKMESGIGIMILFTLAFIFVIKQISLSRSIILKISLGLALISGVLWGLLFIKKEIKDFYTTPKINLDQFKKTTSLGNQYMHDTINYLVEDGNFIGLFLCEKELENAWNERSRIEFYGLDKKDQCVRSTLIRFLTSKNLNKDNEGVKQLTDEEIGFIENGIANANYIYHPGLKTRISKILFGYEVYLQTSSPEGNSFFQRIEYWKASLEIIKHNFWIGVGTGNIHKAFEQQYDAMASNLSRKNRMESHNQYLFIFLNLGIFGLGWFLFALIYPGLKTGRVFHSIYPAFLLIILISMLTEDTLETQAGVTFFAFFNSLFLLRSEE